jgi:DNA polymerase-3 subunit epsilon
VNENALPSWARTLAVFDLETTGIDERQARIVTAFIGVLDSEGQVQPGAKNWLANPGIDIPETASAVHGITTEMAVANGADAALVVNELIARLGELMAQGIMVVAYNAAYDFTVLHYEAVRYGLAPLEPSLVYDPLVVDKQMERFRPKPHSNKRNLDLSAAYYGVPLDDAHEASADAIAAGRVGQAVAARFASALPEDKAQLHALQSAWKEEQDVGFAKWMRANNDPDFRHVPGWPIKRY